jgi:DUF971 family protein
MSPPIDINAPVPSGIKLKREDQVLEVRYATGQSYRFSAEYLRVFSPSAEVRGHGLEEPVLVPGKRGVQMTELIPVGRYAVRIVFDDGHDTGLYTWAVFQSLGQSQAENWARYCARLGEHGMSRDESLVKLSALPKKHSPHKHNPLARSA